ncbi:MAG: glycosyltransferase family 4 protein [Aigarchaeota archaeon]|nr:glycosyltransferase family 4 protein [Aigarchaeota archaeon]MDW8093040.1 glycosyltransferase family 4 protein [Nitrososphaerota archaeon]
MRILHYSRYYPFPVSYELARRQRSAGHDVSIACWSGMSKVAKGLWYHDSLKVYCYGTDVHTNPTRFKLVPFKLLREFNDLTYLMRLFHHHDVVHVHAPTFYSYPQLYKTVGTCGWGLAVKMTDIASVWTYHIHPHSIPKYRNAIINEMKYAKVRTAVNQDVARILKVLFIPNGVSTDLFRPLTNEAKTEARSKYGVPEDKIVVLTVGRWIPIKGHDILAEVIGHLDERTRRRIHLMLVGPVDHGYLEYYKGVIEKLRALGVSYTRTSAPFHEMPAFYGMSDIFITCTRDDAGPLVLLEAMSSGLPSISSRAGPFSLEHGSEGFIPSEPSEYAKYLELLISDEGLRAEMGKRGREKALTFDWSIITERYMEAYRQAIDAT